MCASEKEKGPLPNLMICRSVAVENRNKLTQNQIELNSQADKKGQKLEERKKEFAIEARVSFAQNLTLIVIRDCCSSKFSLLSNAAVNLITTTQKKFQYLTKFIVSTWILKERTLNKIDDWKKEKERIKLKCTVFNRKKECRCSSKSFISLAFWQFCPQYPMMEDDKKETVANCIAAISLK